MDRLDWAYIDSGFKFERLVHAILHRVAPSIRLYGGLGPDAGIDAMSADGTIVYQAKYRGHGAAADVVRVALRELRRIAEYRKSGHANHDLWSSVNCWVLITNLPASARADRHWDEKVVPAFKKAGLAIELWTVERLEQEVNKHPELIRTYFEGRTHALWSLREAQDVLRDNELFLAGLEVPMVGRDLELGQIRDFLTSDKAVLLIHGPGGVGKSRLLL